MRLFTIGYERDTLAGLIARLQAAGVKRVIDVRAIAASRRPGFSKTMLGSSLEAEGIGYTHLRALGTPKAGREAARAGRILEMRVIFEGSLAEPEAQVQLQEAGRLAAEAPTALLCFEADAAHCHRRIVAEHMQRDAAFEVVDL